MTCLRPTVDAAPPAAVHGLLRLPTPVLPAIHPHRCIFVCDDISPHCRQHRLVRGGHAPFGHPVASQAAAAVVELDMPTSAVNLHGHCHGCDLSQPPQPRSGRPHCGGRRHAGSSSGTRPWQRPSRFSSPPGGLVHSGIPVGHLHGPVRSINFLAKLSRN